MNPVSHPCRTCGRLRAAFATLWRRQWFWAALVGALLPVTPADRGAQAEVTPPAAVAAAASADPAARAASAALTAAAAAVAAASAANAAAAAAQDVATFERQRAALPAVAVASAPELIYSRLFLRRLQVDQPWSGLDLVRYGRPPYPLVYDEVALPPGLVITERGRLEGTPSVEGRYDFVLRLAEPGRSVQQRYIIHVVAPPGPRKPKAPAKLVSLAASAAASTPDLNPGQPRSYRLSPDDVAELVLPTEEEAALAAEAADSGLPPKVPTQEQLQEILAPLQDIEFPTEALLRDALQASACRYYKAHVTAIAKGLGVEVDTTCPPTAPARGQALPALTPQVHRAASQQALTELARSRSGAAAAAPDGATSAAALTQAKGRNAAAAQKNKSLEQFYAELLSPQFVARTVAKAGNKLHPIGRLPLQLSATAGCGCTPIDATDEVYGLLAYWHATEKVQPISFNLYSRLSYLAAVLEDNGRYKLAWDDDKALNFVREAQRHGTHVDLGLYRRDWDRLRALKTPQQLDEFVSDAATEAVRLLQTRLQDHTQALQKLIVPAWRDSNFAFDGLTLFFDDTGVTEVDRARFGKFLQAFVPALMAKMRQSRIPEVPAGPPPVVGTGQYPPAAKALEPLRAAPRPYRLNIVVPGDRAAMEGTFSIEWLWKTFRGGEALLTEEQVNHQRKALYRSVDQPAARQTDITVRFLVLLSEPTTTSKKALRARLDQSLTVKGDDRVALLQAIVPVLLHKREGEVEALPRAGYIREQFEDDLAYAKWTYGGVGLWPMPVTDHGRGQDVDTLLASTFRGQPATGDAPGIFASLSQSALSALFTAKPAPQTWSQALCTQVCPNRVPLRGLLQLLLLLGVVSISLYIWNCDVRSLGRRYWGGLLLGGALTTAVALALLGCDPELADLRRGNTILYGLIALGFAVSAYEVLKPKSALP